MTRQHFQALADEIAGISDAACRFAAAHAVMRACARFNGAFNRDRFLTACGVAS